MAGPYDSQYAGIRAKITYYAQKYGIDPDLAIWQLWKENNFRNTGCSWAGACGIAQFMPATAARFGVNRYDVDSSLDGYGRYMAWLVRFFNGDWQKAVGGYNAGEGKIQNGRWPPETREYVSYIANGLRSVGKSLFLPFSGASEAIVGLSPGSSVGMDVLGLGSLKSYWFDETVPDPLQRFAPYMKTQMVDRQTRIMIATAIVVIVLIFVWREF